MARSSVKVLLQFDHVPLGIADVNNLECVVRSAKRGDLPLQAATQPQHGVNCCPQIGDLQRDMPPAGGIDGAGIGLFGGLIFYNAAPVCVGRSLYVCAVEASIAENLPPFFAGLRRVPIK